MVITSKATFLLVLVLNIYTNTIAQSNCLKSGEVWLENRGDTINAHGAGLLLHKGIYYLFGEVKRGKTWLVPEQGWDCYRVPAGGVSCYSSKDLINWKFEGRALSATTDDPNSDLDTANVIERPKVIYNAKNRKFVMWMHIDSKDYAKARAGVAISDKPEGPYQYLNSIRPNGNMSRDMTIFQDGDQAYHFYSSENNATMHVCQLSDDYLTHTKNDVRILIGEYREAPAAFKYKEKFYLITSGTTGWDPNKATFAVANSILGPWKQKGDPCVGMDGQRTFLSQSTFVMPIDAQNGKFLFLADRWNKKNLADSRLVWLPLIMKKGRPMIEWTDCTNFQ